MKFIRVAVIYSLISIVAVLFCEVAYRGWNGAPLIPSENLIVKTQNRHIKADGASMIDPDLGWSMRPFSASELDDPIPLTIGKFGLRMNVPHEFREPQENSILVVGDSFAAGSEEADDWAWPALLENKLGETVLNGGIGGYGVDQIVLRGNLLAEKLRPKMILYTYLEDDILRNAYSIYGGYKPYFILKDDGLELKGVPVETTPPINERLNLIRRIAGHSMILHEFGMSWSPYDWMGRGFHYRQMYDYGVATEVTCRLYDRILENASDKGFKPFIIFQYGAYSILAENQTEHASKAITCARERGLPVLDTYVPLRAVADADMKRFSSFYNIHPSTTDRIVYGHMSDIGNEFIADLVVAAFFSAE